MEAIEILEHLKYVLFQDYKVWSGYKKIDFIKAISELESLEQRNAELEQRVKELEEPKTCEGCKWIIEKQYFGFKETVCDHTSAKRCIRNVNSMDMYEPKGTK